MLLKVIDIAIIITDAIKCKLHRVNYFIQHDFLSDVDNEFSLFPLFITGKVFHQKKFSRYFPLSSLQAKTFLWGNLVF